MLRPPTVGHLIAARDAAMRSKSPRYAVFCMPKSGSSFIKSALQAALQLPFVSLTSVGGIRQSSELGMNSREQELDELALTKWSLSCYDGFVAQHHTRYSTYLARQLNLYGITPIVTVRNILDCITSFDDMMLEARMNSDSWTMDPQFILPENYAKLDRNARYEIITPSYGVWLINFYLSWKRCIHQSIISPLVIKYEDHVLNGDMLIEVLAGYVGMSESQRDRLRDFVHEPDATLSRLNVGRSGRGAATVPEHLQAFLADYAGLFRSELTEDDIRYLVR
jgi:hypothetical protein